MKPDGVATEPMEAEGIQPVVEPTVNEGVSENGTTSSTPQPDEPQNVTSAPSTGKDAAEKALDPKSKSKAPVKSKTTAAGPGPGTRPKTTQSRLANRAAKPTASTATNKPAAATNAAAEKKPSTAVGAASKKPAGPSTAVATSRTQPKVSTVGTSRTATTTATSGTKTGTTVSTANGLSKRPATTSTSAATKPKTTAPRQTTGKPSTSATAKTTSATKTNRTIGSSAPRPATTSTTGRVTTSTTTTIAGNRTATQPPVKPLVTASTTRKDATKTGTTAPAKKAVAAITSRPAASKPSNSQKPAAAAKRPLTSIKPPQPKPDDKKSVPTRKVPPSPRNAPSRLTSGKTAAASPSRSTTVTGKLPLSKPTQSVLPLVVKGKSADKEPAAESVQLSAAVVSTVSVATGAAIATEESLQGPEATPTPESSLDVTASSSLDVQETVDVPVINTNDDTEPLPQDWLVEAAPVEGTDPHPATSEVTREFEEQGSEKAGEKLTEKADEKLNATVTPAAHDAVKQETVTASIFENPASTTVPSVGSQVAEQAEGVNNECCEDGEEEREGSQQVSLSEMSGTQPTEESRPDSAGLAGSIWRAGALLSELDSEDVSCSQQGASELSAPGVLEGTESMDDLGDASLKGAEGVSVGSPDFEKVPDILTNEEDEDDDDDSNRVCDMEVGSERAEDSHKQHFDHDDYEDEDEDVEMASEGITESGLESYGNADEDDLTEDYRVDNLNRIQIPLVDMSGLPGAQWNQSSCIADPWAQLPQPASTLLSSPSSEHCQADLETPTQAPAQATLDASNSERGPSYHPNLLEAPSCSTQSPAATSEGDVGPKHVLTPSQACESQFGILTGPGLESVIIRDTSEPKNVKDDNSWLGNEISKVDQQPEALNPVLPDIMHDLDVHLENANEEEEPETLPADDVLDGPASAPSSPSSVTEDEASDTEGEMQISDPQPEQSVTETAPVTHNLSTLEEREEICGEIEGGGGSDTPQSGTSAASYGFDYMTSNSNAQSSAESCSKSPGIFSLENEEQLPDEAKDPTLLKELTLIPTPAEGETIESLKGQQVEVQSHSEQHYMLCGESSEQPEPDLLQPVEWGLRDSSSSPQHAEQQDLDTPHPYYSTICENTDSPLAGKSSHFPPQPPDLLQIQMTMSSKLRQRPRSAHGTQPPRLPTDLPPRISNAGSNAQLRCLEQHQQHLHKILRRQDKRNQEQEKGEDARDTQGSIEREEEKEEELEKQRRNVLELQLRQQEQELKQQEQELKQRQQIMQWQQELEQQQQQKKHKVNTPVLLSPSSGLCTIYETVERSDSEEEELVEVKKTENAEDENTCPDEETQRHSEEKDYLHSHSGTPSLKSTQEDHTETDVAPDLPSPPQSPFESPERPVPPEFDWGKKADIVHHLINQTLLLKGNSCSPLLLLPGGAGGTLSPLESSLWPRLLPPLTPTSATVTSVSSFSPEATGSSAQGDWTVIELETHH